MASHSCNWKSPGPPWAVQNNAKLLHFVFLWEEHMGPRIKAQSYLIWFMMFSAYPRLMLVPSLPFSNITWSFPKYFKMILTLCMSQYIYKNFSCFLPKNLFKSQIYCSLHGWIPSRTMWVIIMVLSVVWDKENKAGNKIMPVCCLWGFRKHLYGYNWGEQVHN